MPRLSRSAVPVMCLLFGGVVALQAAHERQEQRLASEESRDNILYVRSGEFMKRAALSYDDLAADVYWIRAIQHYGGTKLSQDPNKQYDLLYPLLDLTTSLDPHFEVAYRFGAIFLAEPFPGGAGRPDQAIALLEKGLRANPTKWQLAQDIGFVFYWWRQDYARAADWFERAGAMPGAPSWLSPLAAVTLAQGGNRESSRRLWQEVVDHAEAEWLVTQGRFRLKQLDAMDEIQALERVTRLYAQRTGTPPKSWDELVRGGYLRGIPVDPEQRAYVLNPYWGTVGLSADSPLNPLPAPETPRG